MVGEDGRVAGRGYREIPQHFPQPGWVEHDAMEILECCRARRAMRSPRPARAGRDRHHQSARDGRHLGARHGQAGASRDRLAGSAHGGALRRARAAHGDGSPSAPGSCSTRISRRRRSNGCFASNGRSSGTRAADLAVGTIDTWLVWQLTGGAVHATDPTNASRTMLYDIDRLAWSDELCDLFGVPREMLPEVRRRAAISASRARDMVRHVEAPILESPAISRPRCSAKDVGRAARARTRTAPARFFCSTPGPSVPRRRRPADDGRMRATGGPAYALEAAIFIAGAAVQWLRDGLGIIENARGDRGARAVDPSTDGVYFVPALTGLGAPHWEPNARGTIVGLTRGTGRRTSCAPRSRR